MLTIVAPIVSLDEFAKKNPDMAERITPEVRESVRFLESRGARFMVHFGIDNAVDRVWDYVKQKSCKKGRDTCGDRPCWCGLCYSSEPCDCEACNSIERVWKQ